MGIAFAPPILRRPLGSRSRRRPGQPRAVWKDVVLRKIGQLNTAIHVNEPLTSPGLRSPK